MTSTEQFTIEVDRIRDSGVLGDARLRQLFDYLADKTLSGESPKELVIAMDVFGKGSSFNVGEDALVRVYIHKLRKALASFYNSTAAAGGYSLQLPKGDYRLRLLHPSIIETSPEPHVGSAKQAPRMRVALWVVGCSLVACLVVALPLFKLRGNTHPDELVEVRRSPVWSDLLSGDRPITIVIGDYYLVGETDNSREVQRLIREFDINSKSDLDRYRVQHPDDRRHLVDVGFRYLPTSSASALRHVMAVLAPADRRVELRMMSDLPVSALKSSDLIYIGFVSGLGILEGPAFKGSRLKVGDSYDELIDTTTGHRYVSQEDSLVRNENDVSTRTLYHDYGVFAKLRGPAGNVFMVIAGTRDEGVEKTAEELTRPSNLKTVASRLDATQPLEGLLEVGALDGVDLTSHLIFAAPRNAADDAEQANAAAASSP